MDQQPPTEIPAERLPYDAAFLKHSEDFCVELLGKIPELAGIALVPLWNNPPEKMPPGFLKLRNTQPPFMASLLSLLGRLTNFSIEVHRDLVGQLKMFDQYAAELAQQIKTRQEDLNQLAETPPTDNGENQR
jgi:hypothetical protein